MKKILSMAIAAGSMVAMAATSPVQIGVTEINSDLEDTIVGVSYADLAAGGNIKVADIVKTKNLTVGDILYVFNGTSYTAWVLSNDDAPVWQPMQIATGNGPVVAGQGAENATLAIGNAIFLHRQNTTGSFYVYGAVKAAQPVAFAVGRNLVANISQKDVTDLSSRITGWTKGDMIIAPDGQFYMCNKSGLWGHDNVQGLPTIKAGEGFWYIAKGTGSIDWAEK